MDKLIITCAANPLNSEYGSSLGTPVPDSARRLSPAQLSDVAKGAYDAGASIVHIHPPFDPNWKGSHAFNVKAWAECVKLIREKCPIIVEHGVAGVPYINLQMQANRGPGFSASETEKQGNYDISVERPDTVAMVPSGLDHHWGEDNWMEVMPTREELERDCKLFRQKGCAKPSWEVWYSGAFHNIQWLAERHALEPPYWTTLFFGNRASTSEPATIESLRHVVNNIPEKLKKDLLWQVSVFCIECKTADQLALQTEAILMGGHVRVGVEDNPYYTDGVPAKGNYQLVERIVRLAKELGREVATPDEARKMLGLPKLT